jgi:hypothetical protein
MARTHLRFKNFRPAAIDAAAALFAAKPWRMEFGSVEQITASQHFVDVVCAAYHVPTAVVEIDIHGYQPAAYTTAVVHMNAMEEIESMTPPTIHLSRFSIVSLFIALRMHLLTNGQEQATGDPDAWAHSLFYTVKPAMFRARAREGRINGVTARDTFTSETWTKIVAAGLGNEYHGTLNVERNELSLLLPSVLDGTYTPVANDWDYDDSDEDVSETSVVEDDNLDDDLEFADDDDLDGFAGAMMGDDEEDEDEPVVDAPRPSELAMEAVEASDADDGLDRLGIVALRRLSRGVFSGGYSMDKPALIAALRTSGIRAGAS